VHSQWSIREHQRPKFNKSAERRHVYVKQYTHQVKRLQIRTGNDNMPLVFYYSSVMYLAKQM